MLLPQNKVTRSDFVLHLEDTVYKIYIGVSGGRGEGGGLKLLNTIIQQFGIIASPIIGH